MAGEGVGCEDKARIEQERRYAVMIEQAIEELLPGARGAACQG